MVSAGGTIERIMLTRTQLKSRVKAIALPVSFTERKKNQS